MAGKRRNRSARWSAVLTVAVLMALAGMMLVSGGTASARGGSWVDTDLLNLRSDPSLDGAIIDQMPQDSSVKVLAGPTEDGWYQVKYHGEVGWAYGAYLAVDGAPGWDDGGGVGGGPEHWIDVNRSTSTVTLYIGDEAIASYGASLGYDTSSDGFYSTAIGTYHVYSMNKSLTWTEWGQAYITDWVGFDPDRYNGFHSWSMDANGNVLPWGDGATGGCVALEPSAADQVYDFAYDGMRVEVHW
jgi:hypothetical protein